MEFDAKLKLSLFGIVPADLALLDRCVALLERIRGRVLSAQDALVKAEHVFAELGMLLDALTRHVFPVGGLALGDEGMLPLSKDNEVHAVDVDGGLLAAGTPLRRMVCDAERCLSLLSGREGDLSWKQRWWRYRWLL